MAPYIKSQLEMYSTVCVWWGGCAPFLFLNHTPVDLSAPSMQNNKPSNCTQVLRYLLVLNLPGVSFAIEISIFLNSEEFIKASWRQKKSTHSSLSSSDLVLATSSPSKQEEKSEVVIHYLLG